MWSRAAPCFPSEVHRLAVLTLNNLFSAMFFSKTSSVLLPWNSFIQFFYNYSLHFSSQKTGCSSPKHIQLSPQSDCLLPTPICKVQFPLAAFSVNMGSVEVYRKSFYKISIKKITSFYLQSVCYYKVIFPIGSNILFANASVPIRKVELCICTFLYIFVSV